MKIALYHNLPSGGAKRFTYEHVRRLAEYGHRLTEYTLSMADVDFCNLRPFVERQQILEFSKRSLLPIRIPFLTPYIHAAQIAIDLNHVRRLNQILAAGINAEDFDVAFIMDCQVMPTPYILRYLQPPSLFQCHHVQRTFTMPQKGINGRLFEEIKELYYAPAHLATNDMLSRHERHNLHSATAVITNSHYSKDRLFERYGVQSSVVFPGVDDRLFYPLHVNHEDYVLAVGALHFMKGYRFLMEAIGRIPESRRPHLFIVANSRDATEESIIRALGSRLHVRLRIETIRNDNQLVQVYNRARAFVYAPMQEALGMAPLEAMACAVPVVAVGEGGVLETVPDGIGGFVVERNPELFAQKLDFLLSNEAVRRSMGESARVYVQSEWNWDRSVEIIEGMLLQLTANSAQTAETT